VLAPTANHIIGNKNPNKNSPIKSKVLAKYPDGKFLGKDTKGEL